MTDSAPAWVDDLFPFPTPPALRVLVDIAWQHAYDRYREDGSFDHTLVESHYDVMFDLAAVPRPPEGCDCYPEFTERSRQPVPPMYATPEFVPFGALGDGGDVGWLVPAPELQRLDHPVALASGHDHGVTLIGADTRAGLEFMLSRVLRRLRADPVPTPPPGRDPAGWLARNQWRVDARARHQGLVDRLAAELGVHPDPDRCPPGSHWDGTALVRDTDGGVAFDVPAGWRHEPGADGIGVLAAAGAYAGADPVVVAGLPLEVVRWRWCWPTSNAGSTPATRRPRCARSRTPSSPGRAATSPTSGRGGRAPTASWAGPGSRSAWT